jgi:hypothetical protein
VPKRPDIKARWKTWLAIAVILGVGLSLYGGRPEAPPVGTAASQETDRWLAAIARARSRVGSSYDGLGIVGIQMEHFGAHAVLHDLRRFVGTYQPGN